MRHWEKTSATLNNRNHHHINSKEGPELVLQAVQDVLFMDSRDVTPGKCRRKSLTVNATNQQQQQQQHQQHQQQHQHATTHKASAATPDSNFTIKSAPEQASIAIPLQEIVVVERWPRRHYKLTITTIHQGVLEFDLKNPNRHDMLLAFLQAHMDAERIQVVPMSDGVSVHSTCSSKSQMDADYLQERTIREHQRAAEETWPEKISRRVSKVVSTIQTMSGTLCDLTVCCRDGTASLATSPTNDERDAAPATPSLQPVNSWNMPVAGGGHLEMDEEISTIALSKRPSSRADKSRKAVRMV